MNPPHSRRRALKKIASSAVLSSLGMSLTHRLEAAEAQLAEVKLKGKINHSVCRWCYDKISLDDLCKAAKQIGLQSIELVGPDEWPTLKKYGLTSALPWGAGKGIEKGFNAPHTTMNW